MSSLSLKTVTKITLFSVLSLFIFSKIAFAEPVETDPKPANSEDILSAELTSEKIELPFPTNFERWPDPESETSTGSNGTNSSSTANATGHMVNGVKVIYYKTLTWGTLNADFSDFKAKVAETLSDSRGWARAGLKFVEVSSGQDLNIILSNPANLEATPGCSGDLSCTTWNNEVIINDDRWLGGTEASRAGGMSTREYQHMVINHEVGHWLGHYAHETGCPNGGPAPIMLQQSTGLRGCSSFNAWPLDSELWTLR